MTTILIATDGSLSAERAIHIGADIAKSRGADIVLLTVIDDGQPVPKYIRAMTEVEHVVDHTPSAHAAHAANIPSWMMEGVHAAARAEENIEIRRAVAGLALEKGRSILGEAGIEKTTERVLEGDAADVIVRAAQSEGAEMIVMGTRGLGALESLVHGSISRRVAEQAECSCVSVT